MIKLIFKFINKQKKINSIISFLKKKNDFNYSNTNLKKNILVEYNSFYTFNILLYYLLNYFNINKNFEIKCFYNFHVIKHGIYNQNLRSIFLKIIFKFSLGISKFYKFLECKELIFPTFDENKYSNQIKRNFSKVRNKKKLLNFKINGVLVGDLIYDCYLVRFGKPTLNIESENFSNFFKEFNLLFYFWFDYFSKNKVHIVVGPHLVYSYGIPLRIGKKFKCRSILAKIHSIREIKKINETEAEYMIVKKINFSKTKQKENRIWAKKQLNDSLFKSKLEKYTTLSMSSFSNLKSRTLIKNEDKLKILILPHDFYDAPHVFGDHKFFTDYYDWLKYLIKLSKKVDYKWYVKTHPNLIGVLGRKQKSSRDQIYDLFYKEKNFTILPSDYSHKQIIKEKVDCMITCHGNAAHEYSYLNIPTIACSNVSPYKNFNFCIFLKNRKDLDYKILNLKKTIIKHKIEKKEVLDYFYMEFNYIETESWLFDFNDSSEYVNGWEKRNSSIRIFDFWKENFEKIDKKLINNRLAKFFMSKDSFLNKSHFK